MRQFLKQSARKLGYKGVHKDLHRLCQALDRLGFRPHLVYDIGANHGFWTRTVRSVFPEAHYVLFEPQDHLRRSVRDLIEEGRTEWRNVGLSDTSGTATFTFHDRDDSSTFNIDSAAAERLGLRQAEIAITTVDDQIGDGRPPDILKIDAEGYDMRVLKGASRALGRTEVVLIEAGVLGSGENDCAAVLGFMEAAGYRLCGITDRNHSPSNDLLWLVELAFIRRDSGLLHGLDY